MVEFDNSTEQEYFSNRMLIGEVARVTMVKIMEKIMKSDSITKEEIMVIQKQAIEEVQADIKKLDAEEKAESLKEHAAKTNPVKKTNNGSSTKQKK